VQTSGLGPGPIARFDFSLGEDARSSGHGSPGGPLTFGEPLRVLSASRLEDVLPALARAEAAARAGRWVAGFVAYDAAPAFDPAYRVQRNGSFPLLWLGIFDKPIVLDGVSTPLAPRGTVPSGDGPSFDLGEWIPDVDPAHYRRTIEEIRQAIADGAVYQVNYTLRLRARFSGAPLALYHRLKAAQGPAYSAYLDLGRFSVLSASPELFFERRGPRITCRPMKGTLPRGRWTEEDIEAKRRLLGSEKDRAENAMIVDLVRNDLGRISEFGSIRAHDVFKVETYPTVHQMTSTVEGRVRTGTSLTDVFRAVFPCGSVTGAPKIAATGFIADLEKAPRGIYCGAIGYVKPGGDCVFNVPIRTVVIDRSRGEAEYGVGGGITWDSCPDGEYSEVLAKAEILRAEWPSFSLLETLRANDLGPVRLEQHLARMEGSAGYFGFPYSESYVRAAIGRALAKAKGGDGAHAARSADSDPESWRLRVLCDDRGRVRVEVSGCKPPGQGASALPTTFASRPVCSADPFLFHKTTHRGAYESRAAEHPDVFDVLLINEKGSVTEFTRGNVVAEIDGVAWTPPRRCGLLAGVFRAELLAEGKVQERVLTPADVRRAPHLWLVNSVREWVEVRFVG
jgi:para-aminobenzoate synthetase/4-amino-4-deoxychorismate lyase